MISIRLKPKTYNFIDDDTKRVRHGLLAQDVEKELPELAIAMVQIKLAIKRQLIMVILFQNWLEVFNYSIKK